MAQDFCNCSFALDINCSDALELAELTRQNTFGRVIVFAVLQCVIVIPGFIANGLLAVVLAVMLRRRLLPGKFYFLLFSLSVSQSAICFLLVIGACSFMTMAGTKGNGGILYTIGTRINPYAAAVIFSIYLDPFVFYLLICCLQFYAITRPMGYRLMTPRKFAFLLILSILFIMTVSIALAFAWEWHLQNACFPVQGVICSGYKPQYVINPLIIACILNGGFSVICDSTYGATICVIRKKKLSASSKLGKATPASGAPSDGSDGSAAVKGMAKIRQLFKTTGINIGVYNTSLLMLTAIRIAYCFDFHRISIEIMQLTESPLTCSAFVAKERIMYDATWRWITIKCFEALCDLRLVLEPVFHFLFNANVRRFATNRFSSDNLQPPQTRRSIERSSTNPQRSTSGEENDDLLMEAALEESGTRNL